MGKDKRKTEDVDILEEDLQDEIDDEMEPDAQALQEAEEVLYHLWQGVLHTVHMQGLAAELQRHKHLVQRQQRR